MDFNSIRNINWESLKRKELGEGYLGIFEETNLLLNRAGNLILEFEIIASTFVRQDSEKLNGIYNQLNGLVGRIRSFRIIDGETVEQGKARASELLKEAREFYSVAIPQISELQMYFREESKQKIERDIINYRNQTQEIVNSSQSSINVKISEADAKINEINQKIQQVDEIKSNIEVLNTEAKNFSLVGAVSEYGNIFKEQAKINKKIATCFGVAFLVLIIVAIFIVIFWFMPLLGEIVQPNPGIRLEYYIFAFLIRFSVLFFIFILIREILKNYNANFHMYNLNTHRNNSLQSFEILVRNNKLEENRDNIVKEIAQTIFTNQEDGYLASNKGKDLSISDITGLVSALKK